MSPHIKMTLPRSSSSQKQAQMPRLSLWMLLSMLLYLSASASTTAASAASVSVLGSASSMLVNHPNSPDSLRLNQPSYDWTGGTRDVRKMSHDQTLANDLGVSYSGSGSESVFKRNNASFAPHRGRGEGSFRGTGADWKRAANAVGGARDTGSQANLVGRTEDQKRVTKEQKRMRVVKRSSPTA